MFPILLSGEDQRRLRHTGTQDPPSPERAGKPYSNNAIFVRAMDSTGRYWYLNSGLRVFFNKNDRETNVPVAYCTVLVQVYYCTVTEFSLKALIC